jgi:GNAT superfamily N-acetyltransferase
VDDLVTREALRGRGHADAVMAWVEDEARRAGCGQLHLDSGLGPDRADAHRFYFRHGLTIVSHHFAKGLGGG